MKIEVESWKERRLFADSVWQVDGDRLIQTLPSRTVNIQPSLRIADNLKIDGEPHHIVSLEIYTESNEAHLTHYVYTLEKGLYVPARWIKIGETK